MSWRQRFRLTHSVRGLGSAVLALCLVLGGVMVTAPTAQAAATDVAAGGFVALAPARLLDTRTSGPQLGAGQTRTLQVTGQSGVPSSGVAAVVLNVTVTDTTSIGFLTVFPAGTTRPNASNLNWSAGTTIPNAVTVKVGTGGFINLFQSGPGTAQVVIDVSGYYVAGTTSEPGAFMPLAPNRVLDSRTTGGSFASGESRDLQVLGRGGVPASNVSAVVLNVTVTDTTSIGFLTVYPAATTRLNASNLNWTPGKTIPNLAIVKVGGNGKVSFFQSGPGTAQVVVDVSGYFLGGQVTQPGMYVPVSPSRILDTRNNAGPLRAGEDRSLIVAGNGGVPVSDVGAVVMNATVTQTGTAGYLTVHPGFSPAPLASSLNWSGPGVTIANLVTVQLGSSGSVGFRNGSALPTHVIADVAGYYRGVTPAPLHVTAVASGGYHTCAVVAGQVWCWGQNKYGQLGSGTTTDSSTPVQVAGGLTNVTAIVAGESHTCALTNGSVYCWGWNISGQIGDGSTANRSTPVRVANLTGVTAIAAGDEHTCAVASGSVKCWGWNRDGELGISSSTAFSTTPVTVAALSGATAVTGGFGHTCALIAGGTVRCWGWNADGQLGDGTTTDRSAPAAVSNLSGATAITAGWNHTCAVTSGSVVCWGLNSEGQLGDGTGRDSVRPVTVSGISGVTSLSAGDGHTCAVAGGAAYCWGEDENGQLGDGGTTDHWSPTPVLFLANTVLNIAAGKRQTCALTAAGVKCWGDNTYGQLGDGTTTGTTTPTSVIGLS